MAICDSPDRNTTFLVSADQIPTFQAFVRRYAEQKGFGYFEPRGAPDQVLVPQSFHPRDWSWDILVQTAPDGEDAAASLIDQTPCDKPLPRGRAQQWKAFIADVERAGYISTPKTARFLRPRPSPATPRPGG